MYKNIVTIALSKLSKGEKIFVYDDVYSNSLFVENCAETIWTIIAKKQYDVFNIAGKDKTSIYGLVVAAAKIFELNEDLVVPVRQGYFNELVPRPRDTSYDTDKMKKILNIRPLTLVEGLEKMRAIQSKDGGKK